MFRKDLADLKSNRKWASSHTLDVGILVETKKAFSSTISYPKLKKLPPLNKNSDITDLDLSQNPFSREDYRFASRIEKTTVPALTYKTKDPLKNQRKDDLTAKLKSFSGLCNHRSCNHITISNLNESYQVPSDILFRSKTIQHIFEATRHNTIFKESNGALSFPVPDAIMKEVLCFMYSEWIKENSDLSCTYEPGKENVFQIMDFGLYLGLQGLVELCCDHICSYIKDVDSLDGLPDPLIVKIFSQLELIQLIEWEFKTPYMNNHDLIRASYVSHFNRNISSLLDYLGKVKFDSTSQYQSFCRETCIQWVFDTCILKSSIDASSFKNLVMLYGPNISTLSLKVDGPQTISCINAQNISGCLKNLKSLSILFLHLDYQVWNLCEILLAPCIEKLSLSFGDKKVSQTAPPKALSKILKILSLRPKISKARRNYYAYKNNSKMDVSGINHFTSDESTVSELMADPFVESDLEVALNFHLLNDDIIHSFENCNYSFSSENITSLSFENLAIGYEGAVILAQELSQFKNLQTLNLSGTVESDEGMCYLMKLLPQLQKLDISNNIRNGGSLESLEVAKLVAKYITRSDSCLKELNLSQNRFSFAGIRKILETLENTTTLLSIDLSFMEIKTCLAYISKTAHSQLSSIKIANNSIVPRSLNDFLVIPALTGIEYLDFGGNFIDQSVLDCLADQIADRKLPNLTTLKLAGCLDSPKLDDAAFRNLFETFVNTPCKNINEIDISCHQIGDQSCRLLAQICLENKKLEILNLEKNCITYDGLSHFSSLGNKKSRILKINFSQNYIHGPLQMYKSSKKWRHFFLFDDQFKE